MNETGKDDIELVQGQPFNLKVKCTNDQGDIVEGKQKEKNKERKTEEKQES